MLTLTKDQLRAALMSWEQDARDGKCLSHEESRSQPIDQTVDESTEHLWGLLGGAVKDQTASP